MSAIKSNFNKTEILHFDEKKPNKNTNGEHSRDGSGTGAKRRYSAQPDTEFEASSNAHAPNASTCL